MDMYQVLVGAASPDATRRKQAEQALEQLLQHSPADFFRTLSFELRNDAREDPIRQLAGLQLKVALDAQDDVLKRQRRERWAALDADTKRAVKDNVTAALGSSGTLARMAAAQVVAKIGAIEVAPGNNTWKELLPGLCGTAARADLPEGPRAAALVALGYLLEELDEYDESPMTQGEVDAALTAICGCMGAGGVLVQRNAVRSMLNALPFVAGNFEEAERVSERNAIMMAICGATQVADDEVKTASFQCIARVAELYYDQLGDYMKVLAELTATAAKNPNENVSTAALEFWSSIAEEEAEMRAEGNEEGNKHYIATAVKPLVEMVFDIMSTVEEDSAEAEYGPAEAASAVLKNAAMAVGPAIVDAVMPFINANFANPDWRRRDAGVLSFGLILEDSIATDEARAKLQAEIIKPALPHLLGKLVGPTKDPNAVVRSSTGFTLGCIFDHHIEVIDPTTDFPTLVPLLCSGLEDEPGVAKFAAMALNNLIKSMVDTVENFEVHDEEGNIANTKLTPMFYQTINALMIRADKPDADRQDLRTNCYECIATIIESASKTDEPILLAFLDNCIQRINASLARPTASQEERDHQFTVQEKLIAMINAILMKLGETAKRAADHVAAMAVQIINTKGHRAINDALMVVSSLATCVCGTDFQRYMPALYPLLVSAMRNHADHKTCEYAVVAMGDIARALGDTFAPAAPEVIDILKGILVNAEIMRSVKPPALSAFADITLAIGPKIEPFLPTILTIVNSAARTPIPPDDEDLEEYLLDVRRSCMSCYTAIFQAYVPDDPAAQERGPARDAAQALATRALGPQALPSFDDVVKQYANEWYLAVDAKKREDPPQVWFPDYALLRETVSAIGDAGMAIEQSTVGRHFTKRSPLVLFLLDLEFQAHALNKNQDDEDDKSFGDFVRANIP